MHRTLSLIGRAVLGAVSVLAVFVIVLAALGVYLVSIPLRKRGLAPKYQASRAAFDVMVAVTALAGALKAMQAEHTDTHSEP
jgi:hypothetical protein